MDGQTERLMTLVLLMVLNYERTDERTDERMDERTNGAKTKTLGLAASIRIKVNKAMVYRDLLSIVVSTFLLY
jgi:hypothetical protein